MSSAHSIRLFQSRAACHPTCPLQHNLGSRTLPLYRLPNKYRLPSQQHRCSLTTMHSYQPLVELATALDEAPAWTLDQIAGLVFGGLLIAFYFSSQFIDKAVAKAQRRDLGLCEECGGVYDATTCPKQNCPEKGK